MDVMSYLMGKNAGSGGGGIPTLETGTIDMSTLDHGVYNVQGSTTLQFGTTRNFSAGNGGVLFISNNDGFSKAFTFFNCYGFEAPSLTIHYGFTGSDKNAKHYSYTVPGTSA